MVGNLHMFRLEVDENGGLVRVKVELYVEQAESRLWVFNWARMPRAIKSSVTFSPGCCPAGEYFPR